MLTNASPQAANGRMTNEVRLQAQAASIDPARRSGKLPHLFSSLK